MFDGFSVFNLAVWYAVFLFSTTAHEAGHALAALKLGDDTAHRGGQVTLDPTPHMKREPFGMIFVPVLSYIFGGWMIGWASAPYDPLWARQYPKRAGLMALAGPASNFLLIILAAVLIHAGIALGYFEKPSSIKGFMEIVSAKGEGFPYLAGVLLSLLFSLNLLLFVFNLFPVPPLDGSSALALILPERMAEKFAEFARSPGLSIFGIFIAWKVFGEIFPAIKLTAINLLYFGSHYGERLPGV